MTTGTEFDAYARSYDLLYRDKDYAAEARFVHGQLQRHCPGARRLLELGCGTGGHAVPLAALGCDVHGVDLSGRMLAGAETRRASLAPALASRLQFSRDDIRQLSLGDQYDAVVSLFHVMSYQTGDNDLADVLRAAAAHLLPGGILLFDFWYGPGVLRHPPEVRVKRVEDDATRVTRIAEPDLHPGRNCVSVHYQLFVEDRHTGELAQVRESHTLRYWFWPELQRHLNAAGLEPLGLWAWLTEQPAGAGDWLAYLVCRRPAPSPSA